MAKLVEADTSIDAWIKGTRLVLQEGPMLNLILSIAKPDRDGIWSKATPRIDDFLRSQRQSPVHTVAETIFPGWEYKRRGLNGVLTHYPEEVYPAIGRKGKRWGTYAYRLVRRPSKNGQMVNPLAQTIGKMKRELLANRGTMRSCYEIGLSHIEYDIPLYSTIGDCRRRRGGPCLSHVSFKLLDGGVHLVAFYRSHDYGYKVVGNLLGLTRLQACVAHETAQKVGTLVVHSSYAFLNGGKRRVRTLIHDLEPPSG